MVNSTEDISNASKPNSQPASQPYSAHGKDPWKHTFTVVKNIAFLVLALFVTGNCQRMEKKNEKE